MPNCTPASRTPPSFCSPPVLSTPTYTDTAFMSGETDVYDQNVNGQILAESDFTADISNRMRVPDRLMAHGGDWHHHKEVVMDRSAVDMMVPDRILVAGSDQHISSKSTPFELQLERSVLPPTSEHVRVQTPPRSIKLDEVAFPAAGPATPSPEEDNRRHGNVYTRSTVTPAKMMSDQPMSLDGDSSWRDISSENLSPAEEIQIMRRQIAKLNHRLMAVELENQQQQQREMVLTALVSAYFIVKAVVWLNKSY